MAAARYSQNDLRRQVGSPKSTKGSGVENRDTPCRNVRIYGRCRYEDSGCSFNHDIDKMSTQNESTSKKTLSVESPPFTPSNHVIQQQQQKIQPPTTSKKSVLSAASAPVFTPGAGANSTASAMQPKTQQSKFNVASREFKPQQNYEGAANAIVQNNDPFADPYNMNSMSPALNQYSNFNPYATEQSALGAPAPFFPQPSAQSFAPNPLQYHLYQPGLMDSYRSDLAPWQRTTYDFFIPNDYRHEMQEKLRVSLQTMDGLPQLENYHSLFGLDTNINPRKNATFYGYPSWLYKAKSLKNGKYYALRRIAGYMLKNENAILAVMKEWKKIKNSNIVTVHEAFTTRRFADSSLIFAYDYHPVSKTLHQQHFPGQPNMGTRGPRAANSVDEPTLWGYICQIANALREIHSCSLAARCIDLTKIILTGKNRIRLSACSVLDVLDFDKKDQHPVEELQQQDLLNFGKAILALATNNPNIQPGNARSALDGLGTKYTVPFKQAVTWLCTPSTAGDPKLITSFLTGIGGQLAKTLDSSFSANDEQASILAGELENGRIARLMLKLAAINEREVVGLPNWADTHERYLLGLFRDYVFHQVDAQGRPVLDLGHMISCLNRLDVGSDEHVPLTSHDNQTLFLCTYKEVQQILNRSFNELMRYSKLGAQE